MDEIVNGMTLENRMGVSVLVEAAFGWAMSADWVEVARGDECRQDQKEMKK